MVQCALVNEKNPPTAAYFSGACVERTRERQRLKHLDSLCASWKDNVSPTELIRASEDRMHGQSIIANVDNNGTTPQQRQQH